MKCGKLKAKLRNVAQVRFYENGRKIKRDKNIEIPDAIKVVSRVFRTFVRSAMRVSASNPKILGAKEKSVQAPWPPPPKAAWFDGFRNG